MPMSFFVRAQDLQAALDERFNHALASHRIFLEHNFIPFDDRVGLNKDLARLLLGQHEWSQLFDPMSARFGQFLVKLFKTVKRIERQYFASSIGARCQPLTRSTLAIGRRFANLNFEKELPHDVFALLEACLPVHTSVCIYELALVVLDFFD